MQPDFPIRNIALSDDPHDPGDAILNQTPDDLLLAVLAECSAPPSVEPTTAPSASRRTSRQAKTRASQVVRGIAKGTRRGRSARRQGTYVPTEVAPPSPSPVARGIARGLARQRGRTTTSTPRQDARRASEIDNVTYTPPLAITHDNIHSHSINDIFGLSKITLKELFANKPATLRKNIAIDVNNPIVAVLALCECVIHSQQLQSANKALDTIIDMSIPDIIALANSDLPALVSLATQAKYPNATLVSMLFQSQNKIEVLTAVCTWRCQCYEEFYEIEKTKRNTQDFAENHIRPSSSLQLPLVPITSSLPLRAFPL